MPTKPKTSPKVTDQGIGRHVAISKKFNKFYALLLILLCASLGIFVLFSSRASQPLTWAPPANYQNFTPFNIGGSGTYTLSDSTDYIIKAPNRIDGAVTIKGGRNIVWIGGHIYIPRQTDPASSLRRALVIQDTAGTMNGRIVHLEGLLLNGPDITEGINPVSQEKRTILQLQNIRIENLHFRDAYDRDNRTHPDLLQTWGNIKELRLDKFTGESSYQGLFLRSAYTYPHGPVYLRRTNLNSITTVGDDGKPYSALRLFFWMYAEEEQAEGRGLLQSAPHTFIDNGTFWLKHSNFGDSVHPGVNNYGSNSTYKPTISNDALGTFLSWSAQAVLPDGLPAIRNFNNSSEGRIYSGSPTEGDYVPAASVGLGYISPGYGYTTTPIPPPPPPVIDSTDPTVTISAPNTGSTINRSVTVNASSTDDVNVVKLEVWFDGSLKCSTPSTTISCSINTRKVASGNHTITVKAYDNAGNMGQSSVTVSK